MVDSPLVRAFVTIVVLGLAACSGDATGPRPNLVVTVAVTELSGPDVFDAGTNELRVQCEVTLRATGAGDGRATWNGATLLFYAGPNRLAALDTIVIAQQEIQQAWGGSGIGSSEAQLSRWSVSASIPFKATLAFRYRPESGGEQTARVSFTCGPSIPASLAPPRIELLSLSPPGRDIDVGETLTIEYSAESDVALWTTTARVTGPCQLEQTFPEGFARTVQRTVTFVIPPTCGLASSLAVEVVATDAAVQTSRVRPPDRWRVVDHTPPQVFADYLPTAASYVFAGDTLRPFVATIDNNAIGGIIWEIRPGGVRDSILAGNGFAAIRMRPEWSGQSIQLRLFARDAAGLVSDTLVVPIAVYPTITPPIQSTTIAGDIEGVEFDERRGLLYLVQLQNSARIGVLSLSSMTIVETIPLNVAFEDMDMSAGGDSLVLSLRYARALGIIDLQSGTKTLSLVPLHSLDTLATLSPGSVRVAANGKAYVRLDGPAPGAAGLLEVDLASGVERFVAADVDLSAARFERSFDRSVLILARGTALLQRYDVALGTFSPIRSTQSVYGPLRVDATASRITLGLDVFDGQLDFLRRVAGIYGGEAIPGSALSRDGNYLYQALGYRGVGRARTSDGAVVDRIAIPFSASGFLKISPSGNLLVVFDSFIGNASISVIDLR